LTSYIQDVLRPFQLCDYRVLAKERDDEMSTGQRRRNPKNRRQTIRGTETDNAAGDTFMTSAVSRSQDMVSQHPVSTALVVFGVGLGIGVALGSLLSGAATPPPSFGQRAELAAEKLGRQMLDAINGILPDAITRHYT